MKLSTGAKIGLIALAAGLGYRLYQIYQIGKRLSYVPRGVKLTRSGTQFFIEITFEVNNPVGASVNIRGIEGKLWIGDQLISAFSGPKAEIRTGNSPYKTTFAINNLGTATAIIKTFLAKKWPVFTVAMTTKLSFMNVTEKYDIDTKDYADEILKTIPSLA